MSYQSKHNPTIDNPVDDLLIGIIATGTIPTLSEIQLASTHYKELRAEIARRESCAVSIGKELSNWRDVILNPADMLTVVDNNQSGWRMIVESQPYVTVSVGEPVYTKAHVLELAVALTENKHIAEHLAARLVEAQSWEVDAKRYRWLRHGGNDTTLLSGDSSCACWILRDTELDAAIDKGMANDSPPKSEKQCQHDLCEPEPTLRLIEHAYWAGANRTAMECTVCNKRWTNPVKVVDESAQKLSGEPSDSVPRDELDELDRWVFDDLSDQNGGSDNAK